MDERLIFTNLIYFSLLENRCAVNCESGIKLEASAVEFKVNEPANCVELYQFAGEDEFKTAIHYKLSSDTSATDKNALRKFDKRVRRLVRTLMSSALTMTLSKKLSIACFSAANCASASA